MTIPLCQNKGFTLLETALGLALIALLIGGALAGRSLMRSAELRSTMEYFERYRSAVEVFNEKYAGLPGDLPDATKIWGAAAPPAACATTPSTGMETCDGDGDGQIEYPGTSNEVLRFWQHLANAGLIKGQYDGVPCPEIAAAPAPSVPPIGLACAGDASAATPNASARLPRNTVLVYSQYKGFCIFPRIPPVWRRKVNAPIIIDYI